MGANTSRIQNEEVYATLCLQAAAQGPLERRGHRDGAHAHVRIGQLQPRAAAGAADGRDGGQGKDNGEEGERQGVHQRQHSKVSFWRGVGGRMYAMFVLRCHALALLAS